MKRNLLTHFLFAASLILLSITGKSQSVPNGDFESWTSGTYDIPANYIYTSNPSAFFRCNSAFNCVKVSDPYHGSYAIKLTTSGNGANACFGYFLNANANGDPSTWTGGIPYTQKATGIRGYYKSAIPAGDSATIIAIFKAGGSVIGGDFFKLYGTHSSYTLFNHVFGTPVTVNPDTVIFAAASSDVFNNVAIDGSMLQLDSVSFTGVASQPALFNGDFESWQTKTIDKPNSWRYDAGEEGQGLLKSADAHGGSYALELKNILSSDNTGSPVSFPTLLSTGYWDCSTGTCYQKGGYPFTRMKDTLSFYYKYIPTVITDSAAVTIFFKKAGTIFDLRGAELKASATYQYYEVPFQLGMAPDSVSIQFNSGLFSNSSVIYAGADFKVDDVKFKSQLVTGLQDLINESHTKVFPNPGSGVFYFSSAIKITDVEVTNIVGQKIYTAKTDGTQISIDLKAQPKGVYIYTLRNKAKITARGKIVIQ